MPVTNRLIATAPHRHEPPLHLWVPALSSWEAGCWFDDGWRSWQNLHTILNPSHWREPPGAPPGAPDELRHRSRAA